MAGGEVDELVEVRGIEPLSEIISILPSTSLAWIFSPGDLSSELSLATVFSFREKHPDPILLSARIQSGLLSDPDCN